VRLIGEVLKYCCKISFSSLDRSICITLLLYQKPVILFFTRYTFYDPTGQVLKETVPHLDTLSSSYASPVSDIRNTAMTYDPLGRVTIITNPKGDSKTTAYDHWKETTIDENGHIKRQYHNAYGKITIVN